LGAGHGRIVFTKKHRFIAAGRAAPVGKGHLIEYGRAIFGAVASAITLLKTRNPLRGCYSMLARYKAL